MNWVQLAVVLGLGSVLLGCGAGGSPRLQGHGGQPGGSSAHPGAEDGLDAGGGMADADALTGRTQRGTVDAVSGTVSDAVSAADGPPDFDGGGLPPATGTGDSAAVDSASSNPIPGDTGAAGTGGGERSGGGSGGPAGAAGPVGGGGTGGGGVPSGESRDAATQPPHSPGTGGAAQIAEAGVAPPSSGSADAATGGASDIGASVDAGTPDLPVGADSVTMDASPPPSDAATAMDTSVPPPPIDGGIPSPPPVDAGPFVWNLPPGFPAPVVPVDNPMSNAKVDLGRHLFYDNRLSGNQTYSCATCHLQSRAFTDGRAQALGSTGQIHPRSSMGLTNTGYNTAYAWADPNITSLEAQAPHPMFGVAPVELGLAGLETALLMRLRAVPYYQTAFPAAFPDESDPVTLLTIVKAIGAFERTLISGRSDYDRATFDSAPTPLSAPALRGQELFFSDRTHCSVCHAGFNFTEDTAFVGQTEPPRRGYQNIGLYNLGGNGAYPAGNSGVYESTHDLTDTGKFKPPSLRNLSYTAPYMHDGSVATLEEVIEIYAAGGRVISSGPNAGDGTRNQYRDVLIGPLDLTAAEKADLLAFLRSLDDPTFITDPRFANPW
ncbi:MAG: MbnH family di-heme enzyme [Myxococcales bacterium]